MMTSGRVSSFATFLRGIPSFVRDRMTPDEARTRIRRGLEQREANFLDFAERAVYGHPPSPYLALLRRAGCELGDLSSSVRTTGLDATLLELRRSGVYVTFEEFKGKQPIVRGDLVIPTPPGTFDNPLLRRGYRTGSSGSTGPSTPSWVGLDYLESRVPSTVYTYHSRGLLGAPSVMWREALPAPSIGLILEDAKAGQLFERWFAPPLERTPRSSFESHIATDLIVLAARAGGARLPRPEPLAYERAGVIARWAERKVSEHGRCVVRAGVSNALRISNAALDADIDLSGATLYGGGEPTTETKVAAIEASGARWLPGYAISEVGRVASACVRPADPTDMHYLKYAAALVSYPRQVPGTNRSVDAFNFTSILPGSPKVLLNTEFDDYGILEERACGCPYQEAGLTEHIRQVFSFGKLTGEGVTLVGSDMLRVLEDVLPRRFGGTALDYQLVEEEDDRRQTKLTLIVSPRVDLPDEGALIETVLRELGESNLHRDVRTIWDRAHALTVRRAEPEMTLGGKVLPLVNRRNEPTA
jgi:hypothetical protein